MGQVHKAAASDGGAGTTAKADQDSRQTIGRRDPTDTLKDLLSFYEDTLRDFISQTLATPPGGRYQ